MVMKEDDDVVGLCDGNHWTTIRPDKKEGLSYLLSVVFLLLLLLLWLQSYVMGLVISCWHFNGEKCCESETI